MYGIKKIPIDNSVFNHSVFVDISKRDVTSFDDVLYFVEKFKFDYDPAKLNALSEHFLDYKMLNDHDISNAVRQNGCNYYNEKNKYYKVDILWGYFGEMKETRVFSIVKKNKTPFRTSMGFNTLGSILTKKLANPNATIFKPDKTLVKSAKSATNIIKDTRLPHHPLPEKVKK